MKKKFGVAFVLLATATLAACSKGEDSGSTPTNQATQAAELLKAAGGDMKIVEASGGDIEKAKLLAAGKKLAEQEQPAPDERQPDAVPAKVEKAAAKSRNCWTPPSGPDVIDDPDRPISMGELQEIEAATGRPYEQGDTIWGKAEDRCPA